MRAYDTKDDRIKNMPKSHFIAICQWLGYDCVLVDGVWRFSHKEKVCNIALPVKDNPWQFLKEQHRFEYLAEHDYIWFKRYFASDELDSKLAKLQTAKVFLDGLRKEVE